MCFCDYNYREPHVKLTVKKGNVTTTFSCPVQEGLAPGAHVRIDDTQDWWRIMSVGSPYYPVLGQSLRHAGQGKYDSEGYIPKFNSGGW